MITIQINLFTFDELSDEAKDVVRTTLEQPDDFDSEILESKRIFKEVYSDIKECKLKGEELKEHILSVIIPKHSKYPNANFAPEQINGVAWDYEFGQPMVDFLENTSIPIEVDLDSIHKDIERNEEEYFYSDVGLSGYCEANELYFFADGEMFTQEII